MPLRPVRLLAMASVVAAGALSVVGATAAGTVATSAPAPHTVKAVPFYDDLLHGATLPTPPTLAQCLAQLQIHCYNPAQLTQAYDLAPLHNAGITGKGKTIVIVDAFGSPTIASDLQTFDQVFGLPAPPSLTI
ncbi:MAG TPA: hypothetical protein VHV49_00335, partial [Pseudonocardiaceae bacterium]|nr:hypothetical protein [Pseudonocardiaceae bacterium]